MEPYFNDGIVTGWLIYRRYAYIANHPNDSIPLEEIINELKFRWICLDDSHRDIYENCATQINKDLGLSTAVVMQPLVSRLLSTTIGELMS